MTGGKKSLAERPPMALAGLGFELLAAVVGFAFVGYWIDRHYETDPWGLIVGALLGIVGGLYNFIRAATRATREQATRDRSTRNRATREHGEGSDGQ